MSYVFSTIRFVPDTARGEFVNIGAVAGDDETGDWEMRLVSNLKRAKAIDDQDRLAGALKFADWLESSVQAHEGLGIATTEPMAASVLDRLAIEMNNIVQISAPAPVRATSAENALDLVFDEMLLDPAARAYRFEKKHRAVGAVRRGYAVAGLTRDYINEHATVVTGAYQESFDFSVQNGRAVQLVRCWSFQLPNQTELSEQVKAWAWAVRSIREAGGSVSGGETDVPTAPDVDVAAVFIPPIEDDQPAYLEALAAFEETDVSAMRFDEVGDLAARALRALGRPGFAIADR